jgi:hypothetical protein
MRYLEVKGILKQESTREIEHCDLPFGQVRMRGTPFMRDASALL